LRGLSSPDALTAFLRDRGPFEVCLWDFDGVICDSEPFQAAAYREVLVRRGIRPAAGFFEGFVGRTKLEIWDELIRAYGITGTPGDLVRERRDVLTLGSSIGAVVIAVSHGLNRNTPLDGDAIVEARPEGNA
jgi:beta-phosphoglucomutase-like phosphatase (HAD superfamily)